MAKKILITGATGLIGKEALPYLIEKNYEIYAISTKEKQDNKINWIKGDLFDSIFLKNAFEKIQPQYLLNFAWITQDDYLINEKNILFLEAGKKMIEYFAKNGGKKAIYAGTCFEYEFKNALLKETDPTTSRDLYTKSKNNLREYCLEFAQKNNIDFGWGRIFYVFGHNEAKTRLTYAIIDSLKNNKEFTLSSPNNKLDYMYSKDIALAFINFLESNYTGIVNICSSNGILLKDYALLIQEILNKKNLIKYDPNKPATLKIIGDNSILRNKIGFKPNFSPKEGLKEILIPDFF